MAQNLLNDLVGNAEPVQVGGEAAPKCMSPVPAEVRFHDGRSDNIPGQRFQVHRSTESIRKDEAAPWLATSGPMLVEQEFQRDYLSYHGPSSELDIL